MKDERKKNQWLQHLQGKYEAPLAVKQQKKKATKPKLSTRQKRAIRSD